MAAKRCPNCNLVNPGSARTCDCGYSFADGSIGEALDLTKPGQPGPARMAPFATRLAVRLILGVAFVGISLMIKFCAMPR